MTEPVPFQPHRFASAAAHYRGGRPAYAPALIRRIAGVVGLRGTDRVLDLGCGPGMLAVGFAFFAGEVLGLDPEPNMLAEAAEAADGLAPNVCFQRGSSQDLGPALGHFRLVTMGRSFHWMDRAETLRRLDQMVLPGGAVALFHDRHPEHPENAWRAGWRQILDRYEPADAVGRVRHSGPRSHHWVRHEAVVLQSAFSALETFGVIERRQLPAAHLIDRALSMSSTSPGSLGARAANLVEELQAFLAAAAPSGILTEIVESSALVAFRPTSADRH
jgi:SAM-dependent methyltransferase